VGNGRIKAERKEETGVRPSGDVVQGGGPFLKLRTGGAEKDTREGKGCVRRKGERRLP